MRNIMGMKMKAAIIGGLLLMMLTVGLVSVQAAPGGNGNGNKGGNGNGGGNSGDVRGSKQDPSDPCLDGQSPCGNGDHGQGNPVNGSLHANCNAAQGEVDPVCLTVTPTPVPTATVEPTDPSDPPS